MASDIAVKNGILYVSKIEGECKELSDFLKDLNANVTCIDDVKAISKYLASSNIFLVVISDNYEFESVIDVVFDCKKKSPTVIFLYNSDIKIDYPHKFDHVRKLNLLSNEDQIFITNIVQKRFQEIELELEEMKELLVAFVDEVNVLFEGIDDKIMELENSPGNMAIVDDLFRAIHTVKGGAGHIPGATELKDLSHIYENKLSKIRDGKLTPDLYVVDVFLKSTDLIRELIQRLSNGEQVESTLSKRIEECIELLENISTTKTSNASKTVTSNVSGDHKEEKGVFVSNSKLDKFMQLSGEMIVIKNYFEMFLRNKELQRDPDVMAKKMGDFNLSISKLTNNLQEHIMSIRKIKLKKAFGKIPRLTREVARSLEKEVRLFTEGFDIGVDKNIANAMSSCMTHLVRNSLDHGIELPEERVKNGKPAAAEIRINCWESKGTIHIKVSDDGRGISKDKIKESALKKELYSESKLNEMSDEKIFDILFLPGFSTAKKITEVSGRGVGMDVVKSQISNLNGQITISSEVGTGTDIKIEIPIPRTVVVEESILVKANEVDIAIPLTSVETILPIKSVKVNKYNNVKICQYNSRTIPLFNYLELYNQDYKDDLISIENKSTVIVKHKGETIGLLVDIVLDQLEAVVRPFDGVVAKIPGFKGTTLLGEDRIAYVLSNEDIIQLGSKLYQQAV